MTLDPATLKDALGRLFRGVGGYPAHEADAGPVWANCYATYAGAAVADSSTPDATALAASTHALGLALGQVFKDGAAAGSQVLDKLPAAMAAALAAFWPSVRFCAQEVTGTAASEPGNLPGQLERFFAASPGSPGVLPDSDLQAEQLAAILDTWTRTVEVTNTPATGTPKKVLLT